MPVPVVVGAVAAIAARLAAKSAPRVVGGIVGKGAAKINPVYKQLSPSGSVKVKPPTSEAIRAVKNAKETKRVKDAKAGKGDHQGEMDAFEKYLPRPTIKINSNK